MTDAPAAPAAPAVAAKAGRADSGAPVDWGTQPVPRAFALGWEMAELYRGEFTSRQPWPAPPDRLPGIGRLPTDQRLGLGIDRLTVALSRLAPANPPVPLKPVSTDRLWQLYEDAHVDPAEGHAALYRLHVQTLQTLSATDVRVGKAYSLGRALADSVSLPDKPRGFEKSFGRYRLDTLRAWLNDLASALPPHSARAVLQSLTRWEAWAPNYAAAQPANAFEDDERHELGLILRRQGELWKAVLSGEKNAVDMLSSDDYRRAAGTLLSGARRSLVRSSVPFVIVAVAATAVVIAAVLWLVSNDTTKAVATLAAAAGGLGITWKSVSAVLQRAAKALEQPLWGAAMNAAIAEAVTYLPPAEAFKDRLLGQTPRCLRAVDALAAQGVSDLILTLRGRGLARGKLSLSDALTLAWWRLRRCSPSEDQVRYWLTWAAAAGYITTDDGGYSLTDEGHRLARIPDHDRDSTRAALSAARPSAVPDGMAVRSDG